MMWLDTSNIVEEGHGYSGRKAGIVCGEYSWGHLYFEVECLCRGAVGRKSEKLPPSVPKQEV